MAQEALIEQPIPSLINGVSQQPAHQRLSSQGEAQVNVLSEVADGITVRPPMEHVAFLTGSLSGSAPAGGYKVHPINLGVGRRFFAIVEDGDINVYDEDGVEVTVNANAAGSPGSYTYLDFDTSEYDADRVFALTTVADYTFVVNRSKVTAMTTSASADRAHAHEFLLVIGLPNSVVSSSNIVRLSFDTTVVASSGTPNTSDGLLDSLCTALCGTTSPSATTGTAGGSANDWKFTRVTDNILHGYQFQGTNDTVKASDKLGDTLHKLFATGPNGEPPTVARFSDLPAKGQDGFSILVKGDKGNTDDDFWVSFSDEEHIWKETVEPGLYNSFNTATMPHALVYNAGTNQFSFEPLAWSAREVGDEASAPEPSFIGKTISDIVVHKNRLTLLSDENVVASESGEYFNFWPSSATSLLDSDTLDVAGTGNTVAIWDFAIPFLGNLTLFSATGAVVSELVGSRDEALTVKNARIEERLNYEYQDVRPVALGSAVYFLIDRGENTGVSIYSRVDAETFDANELTSHVRKFLPPSVSRMAGSSIENMLVFLSSDDDYLNRVYVYRYHFLNTDQVMASWSYWQIDDDAEILAACWLQSVLYFFIQRQDGVHIEKIDFGKTDEDEGVGATPLGRRVHLDSLIKTTGIYTGAGTNTTLFTLPYEQYSNGGDFYVIKGGAWGATRGQLIATTNTVDGTLVAAGDYSAQPVYIGREYPWSYELSQIFIRDLKSGQTNRGRLSGRLQLRRGRVTYKDTVAFKVEIRSREDSDVYSDTYEAPDGPDTPAKGVFDFEIGGDSRDVRIIFTGADDYPGAPALFSSLEWEGLYYQHSDPS